MGHPCAYGRGRLGHRKGLPCLIRIGAKRLAGDVFGQHDLMTIEHKVHISQRSGIVFDHHIDTIDECAGRR